MSDRIGTAAGKVWGCLAENGPATATQIQRRTGMEAALTHQAIGWLAREGKLNAQESKRRVTFSLRD